MRRESMFVDIHVLQTVPPSCINRDDTGSPKTAIYGGATRARVSSQSWKHAVREYFRVISLVIAQRKFLICWKKKLKNWHLLRMLKNWQEQQWKAQD